MLLSKYANFCLFAFLLKSFCVEKINVLTSHLRTRCAPNIRLAWWTVRLVTLLWGKSERRVRNLFHSGSTKLGKRHNTIQTLLTLPKEGFSVTIKKIIQFNIALSWKCIVLVKSKLTRYNRIGKPIQVILRPLLETCSFSRQCLQWPTTSVFFLSFLTASSSQIVILRFFCVKILG